MCVCVSERETERGGRRARDRESVRRLKIQKPDSLRLKSRIVFKIASHWHVYVCAHSMAIRLSTDQKPQLLSSCQARTSWALLMYYAQSGFAGTH